MWIGLSDIEYEGTFTWEVDNSRVNFTNWASGMPDNRMNQDCVAVHAHSWVWDDISCDIWFPYICEKPAHGKYKINFQE